MIRASVDVRDAGAIQAEKAFRARVERAMQIGTSRANREGLSEVRSRLPGRLGNAIGAFSDKDKGLIWREGDKSAASAGIAIRSKSERTVGAVISATEGAAIRPVKGRWLWIATDQIKRVAGSGKDRRRMTPAVYNRMGFDRKIGPLKLVKPRGRPPLLVVDNVGVSAAGKSRSARSLTRGGSPRRGDVHVGIVAFFAIPWTSRQALVDVRATMRRHAAKTNGYVSNELRKGV